MTRRHAAFGILLAWLVGVGFMVKRVHFRPRAELLAEAAVARVGPSASYYLLTMGGQTVGYISNTTDTAVTGITVQSNTVMALNLLGAMQQVGMSTVFNLTRTLRLQSFDASVNSPAMRFQAHGRTSGDTLLEVQVDDGSGRVRDQRIRLDRPLEMASLVNLRLAVGGQLEVGRSYTVRSFEPITQNLVDAVLTVTAESTMTFPDSAVLDSGTMRWVPARWDTVRAYRVTQTAMGTSFDSWIDENGDIVQASSNMGITTTRTAFEIAVQNWRLDRDAGRITGVGGGSDVIANTAIASNATLRPDNLRQLRVRLGNVNLQGFDLSGGRQQLRGDTLIVTREQLEMGRYSLSGANATLPLAGLDSTIDAQLQPEPLIQSDDSLIINMARSIVRGERRAGHVAELLNRWVYDNLAKRITVSVPSALQVLETRYGDCNEHTVLYVALARALGLPARTASGVVYLRGSFYYHAWPEVWLGQWVAVDPTFGQFPADAAHLRFVIGGLARQVELVRLIGRLQLTVVE
jgi:hypothetical protein